MGDVDGVFGATKLYGGAGGQEPHSNVWDQKFVGHTLADDLALFHLTALPASDDELAVAWRAFVKLTAGTPGIDMDAAKQARNRIREAIARGTKPDDPRINLSTDSTCKLCGGSGRLRTGYGAVCPTCKGTGQI